MERVVVCIKQSNQIERKGGVRGQLCLDRKAKTRINKRNLMS